MTLELLFLKAPPLLHYQTKGLPLPNHCLHFRLTFPVQNKNVDDMSEENIKALSNAPDVTIKSNEFKRIVQIIANARWERMKKNDLKPFECKAKQVQKENDALVAVKAGTNLPTGTTEAQIKPMSDAATQSFENAEGKPPSVAMQAEAERLKAECLRLKQQKKTTEFKTQRCEFVLKEIQRNY
jgi:hypothetical protein